MATFSAEVDHRDWLRASYALERRFIRNTLVAIQQSEWLIETLVKTYLRTYTHKEGTPTPSPPGGPPALVSGTLRRSWRNVTPRPGREPFTFIGGGGPTVVYSRIQELSGRILRVRPPLAATAGRAAQGATVYSIKIPKRPYVKPMLLVARRRVRSIHIEQWTMAIRGA